MPDRLRIESSLKRAEYSSSKPLHAKYELLKDRLFKHEYAHWATAFPGGNDHGPGHIERVLEKFDQLIDGNPEERPLLRPYELFLAMLSILYHDIGMLRGRAGHADTSAQLVGEEHNDYLIDARDIDVISAAVVSHSSSKHIAEETARFADEELIGGQSVRPRLIAALVRLADELDEDFRRADPELQRRLNIPEESRFFWEFCQRISGIKPDLATHVINIDVRFTADDVGRNIAVNGRLMPFIVAFGDKLAKINRKRMTVNFFLPEPLRYLYLRLSVKPLQGCQGWKRPRNFEFGQYTSGSEFAAAFPEFLAEPANNWLLEALRFMRAGDLDRATLSLNRLGQIAQYLPARLRLFYFYDAACLESMKADLAQTDRKRNELLRISLSHLFRWIEIMLDETPRADGGDQYNEIYKMARDGDLHCVLSRRRARILRKLPEELRTAVPENPPARLATGSSGCFPRGTLVSTPNGQVPIERIQEGDQILSVDLDAVPTIICTRVIRVRTLREAQCLSINNTYAMTPSQRICTSDGRFIAAHKLAVGSSIMKPTSELMVIQTTSLTDSYIEVYTLTTDHPSHNYIVESLVCHNAKDQG